MTSQADDDDEDIDPFTEYVASKRCCIAMEGPNSFFQCLALHFADDDERPKLIKHRSRHANRQVAAAIYGEGDVSIGEIPALEDEFNFRVKVWEFPSMKVIYHDQDKNNLECFAVLRSEAGQYAYVNWKQQGLLLGRNKKVCPTCDEIYVSVMHRCLETCRDCRSTKCAMGRGNPPGLRKDYHCTLCGFNFITRQCRQLHFSTQACQKKKICSECEATYSLKRGEEHHCYMHKCRVCNEQVTEEHKCFMQPLTPDSFEKTMPTEKYIFFDYECCRDADNFYVEACIVAAVFNAPLEEFHIFYSTQDFMDWAMENYRGYTLISHNGGKFDMHFIKQWCWSRRQQCSMICGGHKITESKIGLKADGSYHLRLIDSYRFIPIPLSAFGKTFGLEQHKSFFPYKFHTVENMHYEGPFPEKHWFESQQQKPGFDEWYAQYSNKEIKLMDLCVEYCKIDVQVMQLGCLNFRSLFMDLTEQEIDPFQYLTIATTVMKIYQRFHMPANTIPLQSVRRDREKRAQWLLDNEVIETPIDDEKVLSITGHHFRPHALDEKTFYYAGHQLVVTYLYYLHTCVDIGCAECYTPYQCHPDNSAPMTQLAKQWKATREALEANGYVVVEEKACQIPDPTPEPLLECAMPIDIRNAFYGGRTEPIGLYYKPKEHELIRYLDYTSLYPSTQFCEYRGITPETYSQKRTIRYPKGHPIDIVNPRAEDLDSYFGFMHCRVEIPDDLFLPVLPIRSDNKLMFTTGIFEGTWSTMQVQKAVEKGAKILDIFHVSHYQESTEDMWKSYVSTFLKIKQEAGGWRALLGPELCEDAEAQTKYIADYLEHQGIQLDPAKIAQEKNHGLYYIAKLCLNSLWGKFGQKEIFSQVEDVLTDERLSEIMLDNTLEVATADFINDVCVVHYKKKAETNPLAKNTSIAIAAFTTAYAQLRLYEALDILKERVLYMDTDSVIFIEDKGKPLLQTGSYLGDLTDELEDGGYITEFVCTGPKTYSYSTSKGKICSRSKGFPKGLVGMNDMKKIILEDPDHKVLTQPLQMRIHKDHRVSQIVYGDNEGKVFKYTFNKRERCKVGDIEYGSRPFKKTHVQI